MIFVGPALPGGIAQWGFNYTKLFPDIKYYFLGNEIPESEHGIVFVLPDPLLLKEWEYVKTRIKHITYMTICETETVHEDFNILMKEIKRFVVPSEFCRRVFSKQFPENEFVVLRAFVPAPPPKPYVFYTIGNMTDQRKNFTRLLETFQHLDRPNVTLVVKQQSNCPLNISIPNVQIINEQLDDHQMELLHRQCDCYVSFSHSEGIGMGIVEAALRDKPVIMTNFGGPPEYVKTPYMIECKNTQVGKDYYFFKKDMIWGDPNSEQLLSFMRDAYDKKLRHMNHDYTKQLLSPENIVKSFESIHVK